MKNLQCYNSKSCRPNSRDSNVVVVSKPAAGKTIFLTDVVARLLKSDKK